MFLNFPSRFFSDKFESEFVNEIVICSLTGTNPFTHHFPHVSFQTSASFLAGNVACCIQKS